jgi:hypothetical protein
MAGRPCSVCAHPARRAIEHAVLANSGSIRSISNQHGLSHRSVGHHRDAHMGGLAARAQEQLAAVEEADEAEGAYTVVGHMQRLVKNLETSVEQCLEWALSDASSDRKLALMSKAEARQTITAMGKLLTTIGQASGEIPTAQTNILVANFGEALGNPAHPVTLAWEGALADVREAGEAAAVAAFELGARGRPGGEVAALRAEMPGVVAEARRRALGGTLDTDGEAVEP